MLASKEILFCLIICSLTVLTISEPVRFTEVNKINSWWPP